MRRLRHILAMVVAMLMQARTGKDESELITTTIEALSHEGRGVGRIAGKTVFVEGALPAETVTIRHLHRRRRYDEAVAVSIRNPSPQRKTPPCPHYGTCGGCRLQHLAPVSQVEHKQRVLLEQLLHIGGITPASVASPILGPNLGYRHKARLAVKFVRKKDRVLVGFRERNGRFVADIDGCVVLHEQVGVLIPRLKELISGLSIFDRIPQIEVAVGDNGCVLVFRVLSEPTTEDTMQLRAFQRNHDIKICLQTGGVQTIRPVDTGTRAPEILRYRHSEPPVEIRFEATDFVQINFAMNKLMVAHMLQELEPNSAETVLDLFCGLGNFSLPLSRYAGQVRAVDGDAGLIRRARANAGINNMDNVSFATGDLFHPDTVRQILADPVDKILLDPPRSGAEEIVQTLSPRMAKRIGYISCNPATLARDLGKLVHDRGFSLQQVGIIDMFPHTAHIEAFALLQA